MKRPSKIVIVIAAVAAAGLMCTCALGAIFVIAFKDINSITAADWGASHNTPGAALTLVEQSRRAVPGSTHVDYVLTVTGLPSGLLYRLWYKPLDGPPYLAGGVNGPDLQISPSGQVVRAADPLKPIPLWIERFAQGQPYEVALIAPGGSARAYAKVIPFPIEARGPGACHAWVELMSFSGTLFLINGEGFEPNEEVSTQSESGALPVLTRRAESSGAVDIAVSPAVAGQQSGLAAYSVSGRSCSLALNFAWGPPALQLQ